MANDGRILYTRWEYIDRSQVDYHHLWTIDPDGTGPATPFTMGDPDFSYRSLRGNAVVRWEFNPGSTLFLVWTQSREDTAPLSDFELGRDWRGLIGTRPTNVFLVKMSYWMGI